MLWCWEVLNPTKTIKILELGWVKNFSVAPYKVYFNYKQYYIQVLYKSPKHATTFTYQKCLQWYYQTFPHQPLHHWQSSLNTCYCCCYFHHYADFHDEMSDANFYGVNGWWQNKKSIWIIIIIHWFVQTSILICSWLDKNIL